MSLTDCPGKEISSTELADLDLNYCFEDLL